METMDILKGYKREDCYALRVTDNGFAPNILSGDIVVIHKQDSVKSGELAAVKPSPKSNVLLRRVYCTDAYMVLRTDTIIKNFSYLSIVIPNKHLGDVQILGKVITLIRDYSDEANIKLEVISDSAA